MSRRLRDATLWSVSLTDFVMTLLFLLLLLCLAALVDVREERDDAVATAARCEADAATCREVREKLAPASDKEFRRLLLVAAEDAMRIGELEKAKAAADEESHREALRAQELEQKLKEAKGADLATCLGDLAKAHADVENVRGQAENCFSRMAKAGFGIPPCWATRGGKIEYLYTVTISDTGLLVIPSWPEHRQKDVDAIPGATSLPGEHLTLAEFDRRAAPILRWSEDHDPECRHYVWIRDAATTKLAFKRQLLGVEAYFYKYLEPSEVES